MNFQGVSIDNIVAIAYGSVHVNQNAGKKATLKQCMEKCLTTKHCMHAEISPQHTQNLLLLSKSN